MWYYFERQVRYGAHLVMINAFLPAALPVLPKPKAVVKTPVAPPLPATPMAVPQLQPDAPPKAPALLPSTPKG